jgi:peptidoglycan/xylan/chitin deacetylase (PgdA/CDA1 family)
VGDFHLDHEGMTPGKSPSYKAIVLGYHRIADVVNDPWSLCVSPASFAEHLRIICERARPQLLEDLIDCGPSSDPAIVVTFDDGYVDTLSTAKPLLEEFNVPATVFLPTGHIGNGEFWWDALERILLTPGTVIEFLSVSIGQRRYEWTFSSPLYDEQTALTHGSWRAREQAPTERHAVYRELWSLLGPLPDDDRRAIFSELFAAVGMESIAPETNRILREAEVRELARCGLIRLGSHSVTHSMLATQTRSIQQWEVVTSKASLEAVVGQPVTAFAYPYGQYTAETAEIIRDAGYHCACTTLKGLLASDTNRFEIPRLQMHECNGPEFDRMLDELSA